MLGIVFAEHLSVSSRYSVCVCPCPPHLHWQVAVLFAVATSLIVDKYLRYVPLCSKMAILQVVRVYYATPQVDEGPKNVFSALNLESSSPVQ